MNESLRPKMENEPEWLDTETRAMLEWRPPEKLAPAVTARFTLVLLQKGSDARRIARAFARTRDGSETDVHAAFRLAPPATVAVGLTYEEALMGQFELICADCISVFLDDGVIACAAQDYLRNLYSRLRKSPEFAPCQVTLGPVPADESGATYLDQFLGLSPERFQDVLGTPLTVAAKKARIMKHWGAKIGAEMTILKEGT